MENNHNQSRRQFLDKVLRLLTFATISPNILLKPSESLASNGNQTLSTISVDLTQYPALSTVFGSVAITLSQIYKYPGNILLPFRFILTRSAAESFTALEGYCTHAQSALDPYNGSYIYCPNPDPGHGSEFDINGNVLKAPAKRSLNPFATDYDSVNQIVHVVAPYLAVGDMKDLAPELYQNFPNPARNTTTIRFKLGYFAKVSLTVSDMLGHTIAVLTDGALPDGEYSFEFDTSIWNSGTYFYQLNVDGQVLTKQMIIAK